MPQAIHIDNGEQFEPRCRSDFEENVLALEASLERIGRRFGEQVREVARAAREAGDAYAKAMPPLTLSPETVKKLRALSR